MKNFPLFLNGCNVLRIYFLKFSFQLDEYYKNPELTRLMNVAQFWAFRKDILQKVGKKFAREEEGEFQIVDSSGEVVKSETFDNTPEKNDQVT